MCGVPIERADEYLHRLIALGHRVAVCEQLEDPAEASKRGSKSVVRRDVVRLVTPGTLTEDTLLDARRNNYLLAIARARLSSAGEDSALRARLDRHFDRRIPHRRMRPRLRSPPRSRGSSRARSSSPTRSTPTPISRPFWRSLPAVTPLDARRVRRRHRRAAADLVLRGRDQRGLRRADAARDSPPPRPASPMSSARRSASGRRCRRRCAKAPAPRMAIDQATRGNLELMRTLSGERRGSLLDAIDRTVTAAGSRLLAQRLAAPLTDPAQIARRLDAVAAFVGDAAARAETRSRLHAAPDLARALSRLVGRPRRPARSRRHPRRHAGRRRSCPRACLAQGQAGRDRRRDAGLPQARTACWPPNLSAALAAELPAFKRDGGFVREGYDAALDETRALRDESRRVIAALQARYAEETGMRVLKIRHNNVLGYFVEVTAQHGEQADGARRSTRTFIHRQTLAGQVRFTTTELGELEAKIASAADRALGLELEIFERLVAARDRAERQHQGLRRGARRARCRERARAPCRRARLRAAAGRRQPRIRHRRRPPSGGRAGAVARRHAVRRQRLRPVAAAGKRSAGRIWLLTGPNMAGKSTFLRQNALIAILAQMGSFVPARHAHIGVVDRLFSRVGAADDLARGRSTFMVEMVETAAILNQAGERALVILDEIGRGTATFDGLSIAWATVEHLHDVNKCRALFATHFHELTALAGRLDRLHNATVRVKEWQGDVVFLHEVVAGAADRSYGIQVAKLAGLPPSVIERAKVVLAKLEQEDRAAPKGFEDLPLFAVPPADTAGKARRRAEDHACCGARRAQSRRNVAARSDGSALYAKSEADRYT